MQFMDGENPANKTLASIMTQKNSLLEQQTKFGLAVCGGGVVTLVAFMGAFPGNPSINNGIVTAALLSFTSSIGLFLLTIDARLKVFDVQSTLCRERREQIGAKELWSDEDRLLFNVDFRKSTNESYIRFSVGRGRNATWYFFVSGVVFFCLAVVGIK